MWEVIGAIIGDGNLYENKKHYRICITGDPRNEYEYFKYLSNIIRNSWKVSPRIKVRSGGLRLIITSKNMLTDLKKMGIPVGKNKHKKVEIPKRAFNNIEALKKVIRGITDTDGSVFASKKKGVQNYPAIEITTTSIKLAKQLKESLTMLGFKVAKIRSYKSKKGKSLTYKVCLYGRKNLEMWIKEIGFSNPNKRKKAEFILSL
jgi:hypothetical protein